MRLSVTTNAGEVAARFRARAAEAASVLEAELAEVGPEVVAEVAQATPVRTGNASRSWVSRRIRLGVQVVNTARYARFIRDGALDALAFQVAGRRVRDRLPQIATRLNAIRRA